MQWCSTCYGSHVALSQLSDESPDMKKLDRQTVFLGLAVLIAVLVVGYVLFSQSSSTADARNALANRASRPKNPIDGRRAYQVLRSLCALGPRPSGSAAMRQQQQQLTDYFQAAGGQVRLQRFDVRHPTDGSRVRLANLIVHWHPDRRERVLLCAHYDTRPFPDQDPNPSLRRGVFVGANDGASGVAVLAELAHHMPQLDSQLGVDFVLFDAEEFVFDRDDPYFLGSTYFARDYVGNPPPYRYRWGVLLDMVGDANLNIFQEVQSIRWRDTRPLVRQIWKTAARLGVREFIPRARHQVSDDHVPLHNIAKIPTCDIIDFDYNRPGSRQSYWHTTMDTPDKCSPASLAKVAWVVLEWLRTQ